jgi:hypothetical protein
MPCSLQLYPIFNFVIRAIEKVATLVPNVVVISIFAFVLENFSGR